MTRPAVAAPAGVRHQTRAADLPETRRTRYLTCLVGTTVLLLSTGGLALAAAGQARLVPIVLLVALPFALRLADRVSGLFLVVLVRPLAGPPRLKGTELVRALAATAVVYPAIIEDDADVDALLACMRDNRQLAGRGPALHLAMVDLADSDDEHDERDVALRRRVRDGLAGLGADSVPVAVLFRRRLWNRHERRFIAWERKRGKLEEMVALIRGREDTSFVHDSVEDGAVVERLRGIRYLLTLDLGDRLQPHTARRLVAAIAHPDNAAVVDPGRGLVVSGFCFARPIHVPAPPTTLFEWATYPYHQPEGIPSAQQAAFGEDEFFGQGVIDTEAYHAVLSGRIPPNRVLSHDRLEGLHGRTAAVTEARLVSANVGDYLYFRAREHRWVRGDTHVLPWILGRPGLTRLPVAARIGMARDLLLHLYPASMTTLLALGWLAAPASQTGGWTLTVLALSLAPVLLTGLLPQLTTLRSALIPGNWPGPRNLLMTWWRCLPATIRLAGAEMARWLVDMLTLADMALVSADAVARALFRMWISHRHVLRWTNSLRQAQVAGGLGLRLRRLWPASLLAVAFAVTAVLLDPMRLYWSAPLLVLWLLLPVLAYRISLPARRLPEISMM